MAISMGAALLGGALVGGATSMIGASKAASASESAADTAAGSQMAQLEYLKEREALPQAYREQAIQQLGALYGLPGTGGAPGTTPTQGIATSPTQGFQQTQGGSMNPADYGFNTADAADLRAWEDFVRSGGPQAQAQQQQGSQAQQPIQQQQVAQQGYSPLGLQDFVAGLREDPFYLDLLGAGEEAVLRGASATGGLRSGTANENLARNNQNILRGLYSERVGGLQGMAGLPSNATQIGNVMGGIGATQAAGQVASGQAWQQGLQGIGDIAGTAAGQYVQYSGRGLI
jgi:hypothetical protein